MNQDIFLRQRTQNNSGTTAYSQYTGNPAVPLVATDTWTTIFSLTDSVYQVFTAYNISIENGEGTVITPVVRMLAAPTGTALNSAHKIFPHASSVELLSGVSQFLNFGIRLQEHSDFAIQVKAGYASGTPTSTLEFLSYIINPAINN